MYTNKDKYTYIKQISTECDIYTKTRRCFTDSHDIMD